MVREVDDEVLVLDTVSDRIHRLNRTAGVIWQSCDQAASAADIAAALARAFEVEEHVALRDVLTTLEQLRALDLITDDPAR
jgi:PqqD family protein of HPr-rel-A system